MTFYGAVKPRFKATLLYILKDLWPWKGSFYCTFSVTLNVVEDLEPEFENDEDREEWEAEQKRLDREWYGLDDGYDETHNPFAGTSEEYAQKKEAQLAKLKRKKMSAQQRQINKVRIPEMPQIAFAFECNQLNGKSVDFGKR